jgi:hypothetical protein
MNTLNTLTKSLDLKTNDWVVFAKISQIRKNKSVFSIQTYQASRGTQFRIEWHINTWQNSTMPNDLNSQVEHCVYDPPLELNPVVDSFILACQL